MNNIGNIVILEQNESLQHFFTKFTFLIEVNLRELPFIKVLL